MRRLKLLSIDGLRLDAVKHPAAGQVLRGTVIQAHGISADLDEGGMFRRLAERLAEQGWTVLRFSFRGHGESEGTPRGMTIAGEMLDLQAAVHHVAANYGGPLTIVASSFGAVSTALSLPALGDRLHRLVLWNPVLDLRRTFLEPELPWGRQNFGPAQLELLRSEGFLVLDGEFELGRVLFEEFRHYAPGDYLVASDVPALVVHGDEDGSVSYDIARDAVAAKPGSTLHTVRGSDHGFDTREREDEAIAATIGWLEAQHVEPT